MSVDFQPAKIATKTPVLVTGINGLIGSKFRQDFSDHYTFEALDISDPKQPVDITNYEQVLSAFNNSQAQFILHLAAFTDVTAAWQQRGDKSGLAWQVNVIGTENIVKAAAQTGKHLIHVSTGFVFSGSSTSLYTEQDPINPIEWYGETKAEAEKVVQQSNSPWTILRIDFPFRSDSFVKADVIRKLITTAQNGYLLFNDHFFGPTYIDDLCKVFDWVIRTSSSGLFNATNNEKWSDFELLQEVITRHHLELMARPGSVREYLKTTQRPYQLNTALDSSKLVGLLDFKLHSIKEAVAELVL